VETIFKLGFAQYGNAKSGHKAKHRDERNDSGQNVALSIYNDLRHARREFISRVFVFAEIVKVHQALI